MKVSCLASCVLLLLAAASGQPASRRFMLMPDGDGRLHLVDLYETEPYRRINPEEDVSLRLFTKKNPTNAQNIIVNDDSTLGNFDPALPTRIVIHGWTSSGQKMDGFRQAYLIGDYNIIIVDWSGPASALYSSAKASSKQVGEYVGELLLFLQAQGASADSINIAGHSLGAHAAGVASNRAGSELGMITGMDPAAPLFGNEDLDDRIDKSDAKFVQIVHTCAGLLGWEDPTGHADFYPNGGKSIQPGCGLDLAGACSHARSHDFFIESVESTVGFVGLQCSSWSDYRAGRCASNPSASMGEKVDHSASGSYFLVTDSKPPYAQG